MTTCPQCGAQNLPGMAYCEQCGSPLSAPEQAASAVEDTSAAATIAHAQSLLAGLNEPAPEAQPAQPAVSPAPPAHAQPDPALAGQAPPEAAAPPDAGAISPDPTAQPVPVHPQSGPTGTLRPSTAPAAMTITFSDGGSYTIDDDVTNVGRSDVAQNWHPELDVIPYGGGAPDLGVSRHQALIQRHGAVYSVIDVGSTNGTFVNGRVLEYNKPVELHDGDSIAFGAFNAKVSIR